MTLVDDVKIIVKAGDGGNGATAKKQIYGSKKTAPDGGNGGNGGNVYFLGDPNISDLSEFTYKKKITAQNGVNGQHKDLDGANAEDLYVKVPFGTTIIDIDSKQYVEITTDEPFCVAYGGQGGMGNHDYKPELKNIYPRKHLGEEGEERNLHLVLNLIADIGLVGEPSAGKSSLLKELTNANPKIGDYPFTTLDPNLGVCENLTIADIPGLIEGASEGKGLGFKFLQHIKKTKLLIHCIDASSEDPIKSYETVRNEFDKYDISLLQKKELIVVTKIDLVDQETIEKLRKEFDRLDKEILTVSIYKKETIENLKKKLKALFGND